MPRMFHGRRRTGRGPATTAALAIALSALPAVAARAQPGQVDLARATLEELMNVEVTSASRKEQRATDTPAAVFVITEDDIRRSGMQTLPDLLRLVPGVQVARINANNWAISVRGFNGLFSNKLLVMIDGRTVYNPLFGGVFWDSEDDPIDDIERIEVIRGAGGALWGANALNGVINVITKRARDTQGLAARAGAGTRGSSGGFARYGGTADGTPYRVYSQWDSNGRFADPPGADPRPGGSHSLVAGARVDWPRFTLDGAVTDADLHEQWIDFRQSQVASFAEASRIRTGHVLARWIATGGGGSTLQLQSFVDAMNHEDPIGMYRRRTLDVDLQEHFAAAPRHDVVVGGGYRFVDERFTDGTGIRISPDQIDEQVLNVFAQDEIAFGRDRGVRLTLGAKAEHSDITGGGISPTARVLWAVVPDAQQVWAAVSRAARPSSAVDRNMVFDMPYGIDASGLPIVYEVRGNRTLQRETVDEIEAGYRLALRSVAAVDITGFGAWYDRLQTNELLLPVVEFAPAPHIVVPRQFANLLRAQTRGLELAGRVQPASSVRVDGSYSVLRVVPHLDPASTDPLAGTSDASVPNHQWRLHVSADLGRRLTADAAQSGGGAIRSLAIPAYARTDLQLEWHALRALSIDLIGQNIFDSSHVEFDATPEFMRASPVPRSIGVQARMRLR